MREIVRSTQFKRDVKLAEKRGKDMEKLRQLILLLVEETILPPLAIETMPWAANGNTFALPHRAGLAATLQNRWQRSVLDLDRNACGSVLNRPDYKSFEFLGLTPDQEVASVVFFNCPQAA